MDLDTSKFLPRARELAEEHFDGDGKLRLHMDLFYQEKPLLTAELRPVESENEGVVAFTELCLLIPFFHASHAVLYTGAEFGDETTDPKKAIQVVTAHRRGYDLALIPFIIEETPEPRIIWDEPMLRVDGKRADQTMIQTLGRFLRYHEHMEYGGILIKTLSRRGHDITLHFDSTHQLPYDEVMFGRPSTPYVVH